MPPGKEQRIVVIPKPEDFDGWLTCSRGGGESAVRPSDTPSVQWSMSVPAKGHRLAY